MIMKLPIINSRYHFLTIFFFGVLLSYPQFLSGQSRDDLREVKEMIENYQFNQAIKVADQFLLKDSTNLQMLLLKGRALSACFRFSEANFLLIKAILLDSTSIPLWYDLVNNYRQLGNTNLAIFACNKIIKIDPANRFFAIQLSNLYYNTDEFGKAKDILIPLYRTDTLNLYILKQLVNCYAELKSPDSAIYFYRKVLEGNRSDAGITGKLINLYVKNKKFQEGLELSERFLLRDSVNANILRLNGFCYYLLKDYPQAEKKFLKCREFGDESKFTKKYLGLCYYKQDLFDKAEPIFWQAFNMDTTDAEVCFYYGVSAYRSMILDSGLTYLNKTLTLIMPSDQFLSTLYVELSSAYTASGFPDTALIILIKAYDAFPGNKKLLFKIAYQYDYYLRQPEKALLYYRDFIRASLAPDQEEMSLPQQVSYFDYTKKRIKQTTQKQK